MDTKKLRQKILDLAIHGKLVAQNPNDEPASELLKRINPKAEITCDNGQYKNLPNGWQKTILGELFEHNTGKALNSSNQEGIIRDYLTTSNVYWDTFDLSIIKKMHFKENELGKCTVTKGDLLVCEGGDVGRSAIWNFDYDICIQNHLHRLRPKTELSVRFYYYVLKYLKDNNMIGGKGIGLLGLSSKELHKLPFPLPPLAEQKRIVEAIDKWFALIDSIENNKADLESTIKQTKSKILDLAIHGKLVAQNPNDEPASELLKRINPKAEIISNSDKYGNLPNGWCACRLKDILKITMGQSPKGESINQDKGIEFHQGKIHFSNKYLQHSNLFTNMPTKIADADSLLLCVRAPVGIVNITKHKICIGRGLCSLKPFYDNVDFFFYLLQTLHENFEKKATGTTFKAISSEVVKNEIIHLPPLAEQKRIVEAIDKAFKYLDAIAESL